VRCTTFTSSSAKVLWNDVNPYWWLVYTVGYDSQTASDIIISARVGLCPGNAVTA
jgi:hypothetical protein